MSFAPWSDLINEGLASFGISLSEKQRYRLFQHADLLVQWNRKMNLTAISAPQDIAIKHFIDSVGPAPLLKPMKRVLDIGSGAGFPGLPLKVWCPVIELTMIDAVRKKISFLHQAIRTMELEQSWAIHTRLEEMCRRDPIQLFDTVISRAFSDLTTIFSGALPLLATGGKIAVWKARPGENEIKAARAFIKSQEIPLDLSLHPYRLPFSNAVRTLVTLQKGGISPMAPKTDKK